MQQAWKAAEGMVEGNEEDPMMAAMRMAAESNPAFAVPLLAMIVLSSSV